MRVIIFGASGVQGAHQVPVLAKAGHDVVAVSRNPKPLSVDGKEVETFAGDFSNKDDVERVLTGAEAVFLNLPSTSFNQSGPILEAAKDIGTLPLYLHFPSRSGVSVIFQDVAGEV